ncbi:MAG: energy transducer TonB, partial [Acidobacteriales bacterium]|nr:energy transducer TonB [Terriglobales bacterium]
APVRKDVDQIRALFNAPAASSSFESSTSLESAFEEAADQAWYQSKPVMIGGGVVLLAGLAFGGWSLMHHSANPAGSAATTAPVTREVTPQTPVSAAPITATAIDKPSPANTGLAVPTSSSAATSTNSAADKGKGAGKGDTTVAIKPGAQHGSAVAPEGEAPKDSLLASGPDGKGLPGNVFGTDSHKVVLDAPQPSQKAAMRSGGKLVFKVAPSYPEAAKSLHIEGTVTMNVTVGSDGAVKQVKAKSGPPILFESAQAAVRQWRYEPLMLDGKAVEQQVEVNVVFRGK